MTVIHLDEERLRAAIQELYDYGEELREDWSNFDGREGRSRLQEIAGKILAAKVET